METLAVSSLLSLILTGLYCFTVIGFIRGWSRIPTNSNAGSGHIPVSIVLVARNEALNIQATLSSLFAQNYPKHLLEVILVDDNSTDDTLAVAAQFGHENLKILQLDAQAVTNSFKKAAISQAIRYATGQLIVTTDADCTMGNKWLSAMVGFYESNSCKIISGPVVFYKERNFFERIQTLEFLFLIGMGAAAIGNRKPITCNGANLLYEKAAFEAVGGFSGIDDLASGDDELLLHKMADISTNAVGFAKSIDAMVYTYPKPTWRDFIQQRKRWASKSTRYTNKPIVFMGIATWLFNLSILINFVLGIFNSQFLIISAFQLCMKMGVEYIFLFRITRFNNRTDIQKYAPLVSILHVLYLIYIGIAGNLGKYHWKGRLVR